MNWRKLLVFTVVVAGAGGLYWLLRNVLSLEAVAACEDAIRQFHADRPATTYIIAFVLYTLICSVPVPATWPFTVVYGWLFGFWPAMIIVSFASVLGATIAMLLSRYLFHDFVAARIGRRLQGIQTAFEREGAFYLCSLRLIWAVPFTMVNLIMGLTTIPVWRFWWVSQLSLLPTKGLLVSTGAHLLPLREIAERGLSAIVTPQIVVTLVLLAIFPHAVRWIWYRARQRFESQTPHEDP